MTSKGRCNVFANNSNIIQVCWLTMSAYKLLRICFKFARIVGGECNIILEKMLKHTLLNSASTSFVILICSRDNLNQRIFRKFRSIVFANVDLYLSILLYKDFLSCVKSHIREKNYRLFCNVDLCFYIRGNLLKATSHHILQQIELKRPT